MKRLFSENIQIDKRKNPARIFIPIIMIMKHVISILLVIILMTPLLACGVKAPPLPPLKEGIQKSESKESAKDSSKEESKKEKKKKSKY